MDRRILSFVLVCEPKWPTPDKIIHRLNLRLNAIGVNAELKSSRDPSGPLLISIAGKMLTVMFVDRPVPAAELEEAIRLERRWSTARQEIGQHTSHAIVAPLDEPMTNGEAVALAIFTTMISAVLLEAPGAVGVYWASGNKLSAIPEFLAAAAAIPSKQIPLLSWLQLKFLNGPEARPGSPSAAIVTTGMTPFIGRELEWQPDPTAPDVAAQRVLSIAAYLISNGLVIEDGHSMEVAPGEIIRATYSDRGHRPGTAAVQLRLERQAAAPAPASGPVKKPFGRKGVI